jgi:hypothetical protein
MIASRLTEILLTLSENEFIRLEEFIVSPFFNKSPLMTVFFFFIKDNFKIIKEHGLSRELLFANLYPNEKFSEEKLRKASSNFTKMMERFMIALEADFDFTHEKIMLMKAYSKRNISRGFENAGKQANKTDRSKNADYYRERISVETESLHFNYFKPNAGLGKNIEKIDRNIELLTTVSKLRQSLSKIIIKLFFDRSVEAETSVNEDIKADIEKNSAFYKQIHPEIYASYLILKCFLDENGREYYKPAYDYIKNAVEWTQEQKNVLYSDLLCYCIWRRNRGDEIFNNEILKVFALADENNVWESSRYLHQYIFILISDILTESKDGMKIAGSFIQKYNGKIIEEYREHAVNLVQAKILFINKDYDAALKLLSTGSNIDFFYYLHSKELILKIYFESGHYKAISLITDSIRQYLKRNPDIPNYYTHSMNCFIKYLNGLAALKLNFREEKSWQLRDMIEHEKIVFSKGWMLSKLDKMQYSEKLVISV